MVKEKVSAVFQYFKYNKDENVSKCLIEGCESKLKGDHAGNLKAHLRCIHSTVLKEVEEKDSARSLLKRKHLDTSSSSSPKQLTVLENKDGFIQRTPKSVRISMDISTLKQGCIELVTIDGRPFSVVEDKGFQTLFSQILKSLNVSMDRRSLQEDTLARYNEEKDKLIRMLANKPIFLKIDTATKMDRTFLGINVQFYDGSQLCLKTLTIVEIKEGGTTSEEIQNHVETVLSEFKVTTVQILSVSTDNGSNMLKTVRLMGTSAQNTDSDLEEDDDAYEIQPLHEEGVTEEDNGAQDDNDEDPVDQTAGDAELADIHLQFPTITSTRCADHTLELAVRDALKGQQFTAAISRARKVVKKLRSPNILKLVIKRFKRKPILDNATRWGSTYDLLLRLVSMKEALVEWGVINADLRIAESTWELIGIILDALSPVRLATRQLQSDNLTPGDFYKFWTTTKLEVHKYANNSFAQLFVAKMVAREKKLLDENRLMLAGIYLDPRFCSTLSQDHVQLAREAVLYLAGRLQNIRNGISVVSSPSNDLEMDEEEDDEFERFLKASERDREPLSTVSNSGQLHDAMVSLEKLPREKGKKDQDFSPFKWWEANGPLLLKDLARVISCLPATQVSVERLFSALGFVLSERRGRLKEEVLNAILFLRANGF